MGLPEELERIAAAQNALTGITVQKDANFSEELNAEIASVDWTLPWDTLRNIPLVQINLPRYSQEEITAFAKVNEPGTAIRDDLSSGGRHREAAEAQLEVESSRDRLNLGKITEKAPADIFDTNDAEALLDQAYDQWVDIVGPDIANNIAISTAAELHIAENLLREDREAGTPANSSIAAADIAIETQGSNAEAFRNTGGLREFIFQDYIEGLTIAGEITPQEAALFTSKEVVAGFDLVDRTEDEVVSEDEVFRANAQIKLNNIVRDFQNPELLNTLKDIGGGDMAEATVKLYESKDEIDKVRRGERPLITHSSDVAQSQIALDEARRRLDQAFAAGNSNSDLNTFIDSSRAEANISHPSSLSGDDAKLQSQTLGAIKDQVQTFINTGATAIQIQAFTDNLMNSFNAIRGQFTTQAQIDAVSTETGANKARNDFLFSQGVDPSTLSPERLRNVSQAIQGFGGVTAEFEQFFDQSIQGFQQEKVNQDFTELSPEDRSAAVLGRAGFPTFDRISSRGQTGAFGETRARAFANEAARVGDELGREAISAIGQDPASDTLSRIPRFSGADINTLAQRFGLRGPGFDPVTELPERLTDAGFRLEHLRETGQIQDGPPSPSFFAPVRPNRLDRGLEEEITRLSEGAPEGFADFLRTQVPSFRTQAGEITRAGNRREEEFDIRFEPRTRNGEANPAFTGRISRVSRGKTTPTFESTTRVSSLLRNQRSQLLSRFASESETPEERRRSLRTFGGGSRIRGIIGRG